MKKMFINLLIAIVCAFAVITIPRLINGKYDSSSVQAEANELSS